MLKENGIFRRLKANSKKIHLLNKKTLLVKHHGKTMAGIRVVIEQVIAV